MTNLPLDEKCTGCKRAVDGFCISYVNPSFRWSKGRVCPLASHIRKTVQEEKKVNPLKASKRRGKK